MPASNHIMIVAGEASGDLHAAHLVAQLKKLNPSLSFSGLGGDQMKNQGVSIYYDLTQLAVVGFVEVLKHYGEIKKIFDLFIQKVKLEKPQCVILVDYPGFNMRLAKVLKKMGIDVFYYISPQVWAWKKNRIYAIKRDVKRLLVLFEFEKEFYARHEIDVSFVGHPLIDIVRTTNSKEEFLNSVELPDFRFTIGLLPGSRMKEIENHLPVMIEAANLLIKEFPMLQFMIIKAPTIAKSLIDEIIELFPPNFPYKIVTHSTYDAINACDFCMVSSGTATLETALLNKPMVVIYKTSFLTYSLAKLFIKIPHIGLVNIVANKKIVPECIQSEANPKKISEEIKNIFTNEILVAEIKDELRKVRTNLGESGASLQAAKEILKYINV